MSESITPTITSNNGLSPEQILDQLIEQKKLTPEDIAKYVAKKETRASGREVKYNQFFDTRELRVQGGKMIEMIGDLYDNFEEMPVVPSGISPGDLKAQLPEEPPQEGSTFDEILTETKQKFMPAVTQWQHPKFFGYYPSTVSHPTIIADMFASAFHSPGFTWTASPAHSEVEFVVVDWVAKMLGLPKCYQLDQEGGGAISISTSDSFHLTVHAAKTRKLAQLGFDPLSNENLKLSAYVFEHSFATAEKSLRLKDIQYIRTIPVFYDETVRNFQPDIARLEEQIKKDVADGLHPFWIAATYGTTATCARDPYEQIVALAKQYQMWVNLDCAYAGTSWVCPEYQEKRGDWLLNQVDSLEINFAKMGMVGNVGTLIYVRNKEAFCSTFRKDKAFEIVKSGYSSGVGNIDAKDWMIGFGRRWNSLKFYYNIKAFGVKGYQHHIRSKVALAKIFEGYVRSSDRFEIFCEPELTLITFKLKVPANITEISQNDLNKMLKTKLDQDTKQGLITPSQISTHYFLRLVVCNPNTTEQHIQEFWKYLNECTDQLLKELSK